VSHKEKMQLARFVLRTCGVAVVVTEAFRAAAPRPTPLRQEVARPTAARQGGPSLFPSPVAPLRAARNNNKTSKPEDEPYAPIGSLIRQGPVPFVIRLVDPNKYERSVRAYMLKTGCSRREAQGNMDAFFANANDWMLQKLNEEKGGPVYDYANANTDPQQLILTGTWAVLITGIGIKAAFFGW